MPRRRRYHYGGGVQHTHRGISQSSNSPEVQNRLGPGTNPISNIRSKQTKRGARRYHVGGGIPSHNHPHTNYRNRQVRGGGASIRAPRVPKGVLYKKGGRVRKFQQGGHAHNTQVGTRWAPNHVHAALSESPYGGQDNSAKALWAGTQYATSDSLIAMGGGQHSQMYTGTPMVNDGRLYRWNQTDGNSGNYQGSPGTHNHSPGQQPMGRQSGRPAMRRRGGRVNSRRMRRGGRVRRR